MTTYTNDKGQTQSPVMMFGTTTKIVFKNRESTVPMPYTHISGHVPIDMTRCQAPSKWIDNATSLQHPALTRLRCDRPATTVMVENQPRVGRPEYPAEGFIAAHSCCDECREYIIKHHSPDYAKFTPIER